MFNKKKKIIIIFSSILLIIILFITCIIINHQTKNKQKIETIQIIKLPEKTEYYQGELFSSYGIEIEAIMKNGKRIPIDIADCEFTGFDSSIISNSQLITIYFQNVQTSFSITIKSLNNEITGNFNGLSFKTLPKTEYKVGEWLNIDGGILILHYDDGSTKEVALELSDVSGFTSMQAGTYVLTVRHIENGYLATCTYTITVTE